MMRLRGATGELCWSYLTAVVFGPWSIEESTLTGAIVSVDSFRASQAPLMIVVTLGKQKIRYPVESVTLTASTITANLGAMIVSGS